MFNQKKIKSFIDSTITRLPFEDKKQFSLSDDVINMGVLTQKTKKKEDTSKNNDQNLLSIQSIDFDKIKSKFQNSDLEGEHKYCTMTKETKKLEIICIEE